MTLANLNRFFIVFISF